MIVKAFVVRKGKKYLNLIKRWEGKPFTVLSEATLYKLKDQKQVKKDAIRYRGKVVNVEIREL